MCIFTLFSLVNLALLANTINLHFEVFKLLFNCIVQPRLHAKKGVKDLHILFCHEGDIRPGETFQPMHVSKNENWLVHKASIPAKKQKASSLSCKKPLKIPATNISKFFTVEEKPFANPSSQKKPNETFSSAASLAAHKLKQTISANQSFQKKSESVPSATLSVAHSHKL